MQRILEYIKSANVYEVDIIADAALSRKRELHPDWDILYTALPLEDREEYRQTLEFVIQVLAKRLDETK